MALKLGKDHISFIGVAISAVVAIVAILYYRNASAAAAATAQNTQPQQPLFQTAALPSSITEPAAAGSGSGAAGGTTDISSLIAALTGSANQSQAMTDSTSITQDLLSTFGTELSSLASSTSGGVITGQINTGGVPTDFQLAASGNYTYVPFLTSPTGEVLTSNYVNQPTAAQGGPQQGAYSQTGVASNNPVQTMVGDGVTIVQSSAPASTTAPVNSTNSTAPTIPPLTA